METKEITPLNLSFKIWITALLINTFLGSSFIFITEGSFNPKYYLQVPAIGLICGIIFSSIFFSLITPISNLTKGPGFG